MKRRKGKEPSAYPLGTVALYGPDDRTTTKRAAGVILRWVATDVATSPKGRQEVQDFFLHHGVRQVAMTQGNMGCPHEEGEGFPQGEDQGNRRVSVSRTISKSCGTAASA
jgi:hypothetical protein